MPLKNPIYNSTSEPSPSIQYSSIGPRDTPNVHSTQPAYEVIPNDNHQPGGEPPMQNRSNAKEYEVPIQTRNTATPTMEEEYSTLQHQ